MALTDKQGTEVFGGSLYDGEGDAAPKAAVEASLGCGVPTAVADLHEGETVLDLGSGAGADVLISARRVGPSGKAIGLDMTEEMLDLARTNAAEAGVDNVDFVKGYIEEIPLPDDSVDVVISNCVINLAADKAQGAARGGAGAASGRTVCGLRRDRRRRHGRLHPRRHGEWTGCVAGALTHEEFDSALARRRPRGTSRSARRTASTSTPTRPSSAPGSPASP